MFNKEGNSVNKKRNRPGDLFFSSGGGWEHGLRRGVRGVAGAIAPPPPYGFGLSFFLLVSSVTYGDDDITPNPLW